VHSGLIHFLSVPQPTRRWVVTKHYISRFSNREVSKFSGFGISVSGGSHTLFPLQLPTSKFLTFLASEATIQLSPTMVVTRGVLKKVHVTSGDTIWSPLCLLFLQGPLSTWHTSHVSTSIQVASTRPTTLALLDFVISGLQEFVHQHIPLLPTSEVSKLPCSLLLDQMVSDFSMI
jgi:hypothetical protein